MRFNGSPRSLYAKLDACVARVALVSENVFTALPWRSFHASYEHMLIFESVFIDLASENFQYE